MHGENGETEGSVRIELLGYGTTGLLKMSRIESASFGRRVVYLGEMDSACGKL